MGFYVYILRCADGTYYVGQTNNLDVRVAAHQAGTAARYTRGRLPVALVFSEAQPTRGDAMRAERRIRRMPRAKKEARIRRKAGRGVRGKRR